MLQTVRHAQEGRRHNMSFKMSRLKGRVVLIVGVLVAISLGSTVLALLLQLLFGRLPILVLIGPAIAVAAATLFALKIRQL